MRKERRGRERRGEGKRVSEEGKGKGGKKREQRGY